MANKINFKSIAAIVMMAGAMMLSSCTDRFDEHTIEGFDPNHGVTLTQKGQPQPEKDSTFTVINKNERFVGNDTEFVVELKHNGTETYREKAGQALEGIDPQFFHEADSSLVTKPGNAERTIGTVEIPVQREGKPFATWIFEVETEVSEYMVENKSALKFNHKLVEKHVVSAKFVYDADIKGTKKAEAVFEVPSREAKEGQLKIEEVTGVASEGKTYDAFKYGYQRVVNYTIAPEYRVSGETSELTLEATNVAYLLKHEVKTVLENIKYEGDFVQEGREVKTKIERVSFDQVTYDNDESIEKLPFVLDMNLSYRLPKVDDVWVDSEEALYNEKVEVVPGELTETTGKTDGAYTEKVFSGVDQVTIQEGTFEVPVGHSYWTGNKEIELYAFFTEKSRKDIVLTTEKNIYESTDEVDVVDVKMVANLLMTFVGIGRKDESVKPETSWKRMYRIPDDFSEEYGILGYLLNLMKISEQKIIAKDNTISLRKVVKNHGIVVDTKDTTYQQVAEIELNGKVDTTIRDFRNLYKNITYTVEDKANKVSWSEKDENGVQRQKVEDGVKVILNTGKSFDLDGTFEKPYQNGKPFGNWCEVRDVTAANISVQDVKVDSVKTETSITYLGQYTVVVKPVFVSTENQTKAENNVNKDVLSITYYDTWAVGDKYVKDDVEEFVEENENGGIDAGIRYYQIYDISGRRFIGEDRVSFSHDVKGRNEGKVNVESVNSVSQSGKGYTGTGVGVYTNDLVRDGVNHTMHFDRSADGAKTAKVTAPNGVTVSRTFTPEFKIEDAGVTAGMPNVGTDEVIYPYTSDVKAVLTVKNVSVSKSASTSINFVVTVPDEYIKDGDEVEEFVEENTNGGIDAGIRYYQNFTKSGRRFIGEDRVSFNYNVKGTNEGNVNVESVNSVSQSGNGYTGTGVGVYTNSLVRDGVNHTMHFDRSADGAKTAKVTAPNGVTVSRTFTPEFKIEDAGVTAGSSSVSEGYYVYPFSSDVKAVLTVKNVSVSKSASTSINFLVKRNVPKIIPEEWGTIIGAGMSCVPAHLVNNQNGFVSGNVADGNGAQTAASCLTIVTDKGAVPVIFGWADQEPRVPSTSQILNSTFTEGNYTGYNSGWYNGKVWVPAMAADSGQGIGYSIPSQSNIRFVRNESLVMWGWRSGNYSTKLSGYTTSVNDGTLTITYNGQIVLEIR